MESETGKGREGEGREMGREGREGEGREMGGRGGEGREGREGRGGVSCSIGDGGDKNGRQ